MNCPTCGSIVKEGSAFCSNCGTPVAAAPAAAPETAAAPAAPAAAAPAAGAAATTPATDAAAQLQQQIQQQWAAQQAPAAPAAAAQAAPVPPAAVAAAAAPAAAAAATAPADPAQLQQQIQQQWAAQQAGQSQGQPGYRAQPQPQPAAQKVYAQTTGISRALAMSTYWGLFPLIFAAAVGNKDNDPFLRHHLNQALVIFIGMIISGLLSFIVIGGILAIFLLVITIMGTIQAYHSEMTDLPLIGKIKIIK